MWPEKINKLIFVILFASLDLHMIERVDGGLSFKNIYKNMSPEEYQKHSIPVSRKHVLLQWMIITQCLHMQILNTGLSDVSSCILKLLLVLLPLNKNCSILPAILKKWSGYHLIITASPDRFCLQAVVFNFIVWCPMLSYLSTVSYPVSWAIFENEKQQAQNME